MTPARPFDKFRQVNQSDAAFPTWVTSELDVSFVDPGTATGRVIRPLAVQPGGGGLVPCLLALFPYCLGADDDVAVYQVVGYRKFGKPYADGRQQYFRFLVATITATFSTAVGLAGGHVLNTERFADTITIGFEGTLTANTTREGSIVLYSPANNTPAHVLIPLVGVEAVELVIDNTTGTGTGNALFSFIDHQ